MARYPFPWDLFFALARDLPSGRRSLAADAALMVSRIDPPPVVSGSEHIPKQGPVLIAANHYQRHGLWIGWPGVVITCAMTQRRWCDPAIHWLTVGGLRLWQTRGTGPTIPCTPSLLRAVARIYGMSALPPSDGPARAAALLGWIRRAEEGGALGVFPEGLLGRSHGLRQPDPAFASLYRLLAARGVPAVPVGIFERDGVLQILFGPCLSPVALPQEQAADHVMRAIADLLPAELRGPYGE